MSNGQVITELFEQIVHSEERIKQRFEDLKKGMHLSIFHIENNAGYFETIKC